MPLISRLTKRLRKHDNNETESGKLVLFVLGAILIAALILGIIQKTNFGVAHSLLPQTDGLMRVATIDKLTDYVGPITPPTQTFGAEFFIAGIYTQDHGTIPKDTVALVYTRDNYRYIEIDYLPNRTLEEQETILGFYDQEAVTLTDTTRGTIIDLHNIPACLEPTDTIPGKCKIQTQLIFQIDNTLIMISADGTHATKGELIETARSILNQNPSIKTSFQQIKTSQPSSTETIRQGEPSGSQGILSKVLDSDSAELIARSRLDASSIAASLASSRKVFMAARSF